MHDPSAGGDGAASGADERHYRPGHRGGSSFGERGITKRIEALEKVGDLRGERLLDLGCGPGTYTIRMSERFDHTEAVDIEPERLSDFRAAIEGSALASKITIHEMSGAALTFPDRHFDVVTSIEVLEHVDNVDVTVREVWRVLRPGGQFLVTVPNRGFPLETHGFIWRGKPHPSTHFPLLTWIPPVHRRIAQARAFTPSSLTKAVEAAGFERVGLDFIMPPFDRSRAGKHLRTVTDALEHTPLRRFGISLVAGFRKP